MLDDLNLLILNHVLFFFYNRTLILLHNGLKLSRGSWELTFTPPLTPPSNLATLSYFSKTVLKRCFKQFLNHRGYCQKYKLLSVMFKSSGAAFYMKVIDRGFLKPPKLSHLSDF